MKKRVGSKILAGVLSFAFLFSNLSVITPKAGEGDTETISIEMNQEPLDEIVICDNGVSSEEAYEGYLTDAFELNSGISLFSSDYQGSKLTGSNKVAYDVLKKQITAIANGESDSSEIYITLTDMLGKLEFSPEELGVESFVVTTEKGETIVNPVAKENIRNMILIDYNLVLYNLISDCPYELYWYEKTIGCRIANFQYSISCKRDILTIEGTNAWVFEFAVDSRYKADDLDRSTSVDITKTSIAKDSVENVNAILSEAASLSDYEKLVYYKNAICDLVTYNREAASSGTSGYETISPWQLVDVFDGDPSTNVVCEGYAKAFQYLCEKTTFNHPNIYGYFVTGQSNSNPHMWNIVHMEDDKNYLVDVTNCDSYTDGYPDKLFLKGTTDVLLGDNQEPVGYKLSPNSYPIRYVYDNNTLLYFDWSELELSKTDYISNSASVALYSSTSEGDVVSIAKLTGGGEVSINESTTISATEKTGFTFLGWYKVTDKTISDGVVTSLNYDTECISSDLVYTFVPTESLELVAIYEANQNMDVKITYAPEKFTVKIDGVLLDDAKKQNFQAKVGSVIEVHTSDDTFSHWEDSYGNTLSNGTSYIFTLVQSCNINGINTINETDKVAVSFVSGYKQVLARHNWDKDSTIEVPKDPNKTDFKFIGWSINGGSEISSTEILDAIKNTINTALSTDTKDDDSIMIEAKYSLINNNVTVSVYNGEAAAATEYSYKKHSVVKLSATEVSGKKFSCWKNLEGDILSYNNNYTFYATDDITVIAYYVNDTIVVEPKGTTNMLAINKDTDGVSFVSMSSVPENCTIEKAGIIVTMNASIASDENLFVANSSDVKVFGDAWTGNAYRYTLTVHTLNKVYARAYLVYKDKNGNYITVYGKIVSAKVNE